jgi:hypothetical protein
MRRLLHWLAHRLGLFHGPARFSHFEGDVMMVRIHCQCGAASPAEDVETYL